MNNNYPLKHTTILNAKNIFLDKNANQFIAIYIDKKSRYIYDWPSTFVIDGYYMYCYVTPFDKQNNPSKYHPHTTIKSIRKGTST